jgi:RNA polymerase sigma-70 factor (ECF subfamily)
MQTMTEEHIISECIKGNPMAQRQLYEGFAPKMYGVCLRYADRPEEAQDILQDGFVKVFEKLKSYQSKGSFEGWIRRIVVNTALDHIRKEKKRQMDQSWDDVDYKLADDQDIESNLAAEDLLKVLHEIPVGYRTVFNMYVIEGYNHREIAKELGISENTSKSQLSRAKSHLKKLIVELNLD